MMRVRWGLLGAGWIARRAIAPAIHSADAATLTAVAARDLARAQALTPAGRACDDYAAVIDDPDVDAVYIALSNDGHLPWAIAALEAGKAVLCEKPLGCTAHEARQMRDAAARTGGLLVEATWNLWHPRTVRAAALLASDAIGPLRAYSAAFVFDGVADGNYRLDPTRGGGALLDVGCYPLTGAAWATGGPFESVDDVEVVWSDSGVDLTAGARLIMGGVPVNVRGSFREPHHEALVLEGDHGQIEMTGNDAFVSWLQPGTLRVLDPDGERVEHFAPVDPYRLMVENVSRAVLGQDCWLPDPQWSIVVAEAMDAILAVGAARR
ncbi:MAG: Gfo/Idh/MocA family protein [Actinomycetota bacterium]